MHSLIFAKLIKSVTIGLLLIYLTGVFEIKQWVKMPVLFHHFIEHQSDHMALSFVDFLDLHYAHESNHQSQEQDHKNLPFGNDLSHAVYLFAVQVPAEANILLHLDRPFTQIIKNHFDPCQLPESYGNAVWQPPRLNS